MKAFALLALISFTASVGAGDRAEPNYAYKLERPWQKPVTYVF